MTGKRVGLCRRHRVVNPERLRHGRKHSDSRHRRCKYDCAQTRSGTWLQSNTELFEDDKLEKFRQMYETSTPTLTLQMINYAKNQIWHEEVLQVNGGIGVDLVLENGGTSSLVRRMKCTKRGGTVSQVGYLGKQNPEDLREMLSLLIDRKVNLRGINVGSKHDFEDLNAALAATAMRFCDTIDRKFSFWDAEAAIEHVWQAKQVGKIVLHMQHGSGQ